MDRQEPFGGRRGGGRRRINVEKRCNCAAIALQLRCNLFCANKPYALGNHDHHYKEKQLTQTTSNSHSHCTMYQENKSMTNSVMSCNGKFSLSSDHIFFTLSSYLSVWMGPLSSMGSPMTLMILPKVAGPTGMVMGPPVSAQG